MNKILVSLWSVFCILLITGCNKDIKHDILTNQSQLILDSTTSDAYFSLGKDTKYEILTDLPAWIKSELIIGDENKLHFWTDLAPKKYSRTAEIIISLPTQTVLLRIIQPKVSQKGLYILSEAGWQSSQSDIAYYDRNEDKLYTRYFSQQNGRALGDVGNDLTLYGSKLYCVVSGSNAKTKNSYIEVIDPKTCKSIKKIPFIINTQTNEYDLPRRFIFDHGKGYITGFSGIVARLDTLSLELDAFAKLGNAVSHSEGITLHDNKLYICNSGYGFGNTISIVDVNNMKEIKQIEVAQNPVNIISANNKIYFQTAFVRSLAESSNLYELDPNTHEILHQFNIKASKLTIMGEKLYTGDFDWVNMEDEASIVNLSTREVTPLKLDEDMILTVYSFDSNPTTKEIYVGTQGDDVVIMDQTGKVLKSINVDVPYINKVIPIVW